MQDDIAAGDHFGGVPISLDLHIHIDRGGRGDLHVVVNFNLREESNILRFQPKGDIPTAIPTATLDTLPLLDSRHDDVHQLTQEMLHILASQISLDSYRISPGSNSPRRDTSLGLERLRARVGDRLHGHTRHMQPAGVLLRRLLDVAVHRDTLNPGYVIEVDGLAQQPEHVASAGPAQGPVLVVRRAVIPFAQSGGFRGRSEPRGHVHVAEGEDVGGNG